MDSGDMLKQLLDKFTVEEKVIQEELKLVQEQIDQLESRLNECSTSRDRLSTDRERVFDMMKRYTGGKFDPPPAVLARLDTIAAETLARFDSPFEQAAPRPSTDVVAPLETTRPAPPPPARVEPAFIVQTPAEPEASVVQPSLASPGVDLAASMMPDVDAGRQTLRITGAGNQTAQSLADFGEAALPATEQTEDPATIDWDEPAPPAPPLQTEEIVMPVPPPVEPVAPSQPVAAVSDDQQAQPAAAADTSGGQSSVDFGGEEEADLKSINDALRSLFR